MPTPGPLELVIILVIVVMLFGVGKLPEVGSAVGKTIREFRRSMNPESEGKAEKAAKAEKTETAEEPKGDATAQG